MWKQLCIIYTVLLTTPHSIKIIHFLPRQVWCHIYGTVLILNIIFIALNGRCFKIGRWTKGRWRMIPGDLHTHKRAHSERDMTTKFNKHHKLDNKYLKMRKNNPKINHVRIIERRTRLGNTIIQLKICNESYVSLLPLWKELCASSVIEESKLTESTK